MNWKFWTWFEKDSETVDEPPLMLEPEHRVILDTPIDDGLTPRERINRVRRKPFSGPTPEEKKTEIEAARERLALVQQNRLQTQAFERQAREDLKTVDRAEYEAHVAATAQAKRDAIHANTAKRAQNPNRPPKGTAEPLNGSLEADRMNLRHNFYNKDNLFRGFRMAGER